MAGGGCSRQPPPLRTIRAMNSDYGLDIEEMAQVIDDADVLVVRFHVVPQRLLVDMRSAEDDPPLVRLVPSVPSAEARNRIVRLLADEPAGSQNSLFSGSPALNRSSYLTRSSPVGTRWTARAANSRNWRAFASRVLSAM